MGLSASSPAATAQSAAEPSKQHQVASPPSECPMHQEKMRGNCLKANEVAPYAQRYLSGKKNNCIKNLEPVPHLRLFAGSN